ncbi:MAG: hypothetical protein JSS29_17505 [Proteobacteria bacterium]|nr:hypothetical protein [Pseudomonadota bacterium]
MSARALLLLLALAGASRAGVPDAPLPAEAAPLASHALLTALAAAGPRLVAVGDRGIIVLSDDAGHSWVQAQAVPTQALLTGVCFFDAAHGIAVGHDQSVLTSADAGRTWTLVHRDPAAPGPLLDVWCGPAGRALAVGAYGTFLASGDAGATWQAREFHAEPAPRAAAPRHDRDADTQGGFHLNRITAAGTATLYIAAEAGHLYRSDDAGEHWRELASPYEGSFFGVLPLQGAALLAYGLRGNLFRSEDGGASWRRLDSGTLAMLDGGARLAGGGVVVVGLTGVVLVSKNGGSSFALRQQRDHAGIAAVLALPDGRLVIAGEDGVHSVAPGAAAEPAP